MNMYKVVKSKRGRKKYFKSLVAYILTYLLTHSMVQSPSWAANWFAACQEIPHISRNPKVHYRTHKSTPPVSILGQPNPVHIPTSHLLEIHPNIIHPSTSRSPQWSLSLWFPNQDPICPPSPHPYAPHAQPISFFSVSSPVWYWVRSTDHLAPRYAISSSPPLIQYMCTWTWSCTLSCDTAACPLHILPMYWILVHQAVFFHSFIHHCMLESHKPFSKMYTLQNFQ